MKIVLATHNTHKRDELQSVLQQELRSGRGRSDQSVTLVTLDEIAPRIGEIDESGSTLEENALIKARTVFDRLKLPTLADDTGLEVRALYGAPGVYSARYSSPDATYDSNIEKLLHELEPHKDRSARFRTVIAFINEDGEESLFDGSVEGIILQRRQGSAGFGYDPVFAPIEDSAHRSFAEMSAEEKNSISHRGRAVRKLTQHLKQEVKA